MDIIFSGRTVQPSFQANSAQFNCTLFTPQRAIPCVPGRYETGCKCKAFNGYRDSRRQGKPLVIFGNMDLPTDAPFDEKVVDGPVLFTTMNGNKVTLVSLTFSLMNVSYELVS